MSYGRRGPHGPESFDTRQEIETGSLTGSNEITCWLADWVDAFFMHIQGSGRVLLQDGRFLHLSFAAKSGLPFVSIGKILIERGLISAKHMSMQTLRRWLADHSDQARQLMWQNKSFVFFKINHEGKPDSGPIGAAKRPLTPRRSLALDNSHWFYGMPVWLETLLPPESPAADKRFHHVMITQDTGSAIRGLARGDIFWGSGSQAEIIAGHMNSPGEMVVLLPHAVCRQLGLRQ